MVGFEQGTIWLQQPCKLSGLVKDGGEIVVDFKCCEDNYFELMVSDNGLGIREDIDLANPKTLGLRLVHTLATKQLKGEVELDTSHGVMFKIKFL